MNACNIRKRLDTTAVSEEEARMSNCGFGSALLGTTLSARVADVGAETPGR